MSDHFILPPPTTRHGRLWAACKRMAQDYSPYGEEERFADDGKDYPDCSGGCRHFAPLHVYPGDEPTHPTYEGDDGDWGVCVNPRSHRCGLLTFEHQGCSAFEGYAESPWEMQRDPGESDEDFAARKTLFKDISFGRRST
jgi:hypothetical protein